MYGTDDRHFCRNCGEICILTKYCLSDDEVEQFKYDEAKMKEFRKKLYKEYLKE